MRITATRRLQYAIGHRVYRHESKCRHLHGHNFEFFLTAEANKEGPEGLDDRGRVVDFSILKSSIGTWIETNWDHGFVLWEGDDEAIAACRMIPSQKLFLLPYNPTAENLGRYLLTKSNLELVGPQIHLAKITVWETENGIAEVSL
jgi:6-pyruvoyltetrahydropterin/6-carboxytetrahydropterin synthase